MQGIKAVARRLPRPGEVSVQIRPDVRVLLLSDAINSLTERVQNELVKHKVRSMDFFNFLNTTVTLLNVDSCQLLLA